MKAANKGHWHLWGPFDYLISPQLCLHSELTCTTHFSMDFFFNCAAINAINAVCTEHWTHLPRGEWCSVYNAHSSGNMERSHGQRADGSRHRQAQTEPSNKLKNPPGTHWALWNSCRTICMMWEEQKQLQVNWFNLFGEIGRKCWVAWWEVGNDVRTAGLKEVVASTGPSCLSRWSDTLQLFSPIIRAPQPKSSFGFVLLWG